MSNEATVWQLPSSGGSTRSTSEAPAAAAAASSPAAADGTRSATVIEFDHTKLEVWIDEVALSLENGELMADFMDGETPPCLPHTPPPTGIHSYTPASIQTMSLGLCIASRCPLEWLLLCKSPP